MAIRTTAWARARIASPSCDACSGDDFLVELMVVGGRGRGKWGTRHFGILTLIQPPRRI